MRFLSLFSGIEAASVAWEPLGWECVAVAEIEPFPCAVLAARYPRIPNLGDVTKIKEKQIAALGRVDVVVGGFPCQDVSIAGKRRGFKHADGSSTRSGLFWDAMRLVHWAALHCDCRWVVLENVPGLFNSHAGRDFAGVVGALAGTRFSPPRDGLAKRRLCSRTRWDGRVERAGRAMVRTGATAQACVRCRGSWRLVGSTPGIT